jgi:hypothetical protein
MGRAFHSRDDYSAGAKVNQTTGTPPEKLFVIDKPARPASRRQRCSAFSLAARRIFWANCDADHKRRFDGVFQYVVAGI